MAHDVFISYASKDKTIADAVCAGLEKEGIRCWIAPRDILPSDNYDDAIIRAISSARVMVVIFSSNIFQSQFVKSEVERGFSKGLIIAPFRIENVAPEGGLELYLGRRHWLDAMTPPMEAHIHTLAVTVRSMLTSPEEAPEAEKPRLSTASVPRPAASTPPKMGRQSPRKPSRRAKLPTGTLTRIGVVGGIILVIALVLLVKSLTGNQPAALVPTQTAGLPTEAGIAARLTAAPASSNPVAPTVASTFASPIVAPTAAPTLPSGGESAPTTNGPAAGSGNWLTLTDLPRAINSFVVDPANSKTIYAATGDYTGAGAGIYKSEDQGLSWKKASQNLPNQPVLTLAILQQGGARIFLASTEMGMYASSDEAATWTEVSNPGSMGSRTHQFILSTDGKSVYVVVERQGLARSENGGQTWEPLNDGLPVRDNATSVQALALDPTNPMILYAGMGQYAGQGDGVYKSTDGGMTWAPSNKGMLDYAISALAVDPRNPQIVFAGCDGGELFKSSDGGQTWTSLTERLVLRQYGEPRQIHNIQIDPADGSIYLLGDNSGVLVSKDGGEKWRLLGNPPGVDQPTFAAWGIIMGEKPVILVATMYPEGLGWRYSTEPVALAPTATPAAAEAPASTVKITGTWQSITDLPREVTTIVIDPTDPKMLFAGTGSGGVYKSVDGGLTWKVSSSGLNDLSVNSLAFSSGNPPVLYATGDHSSEIYASQDRGETWTSQGNTGIYGSYMSRLVASPTNANLLYYVSTEGSARSEDGGQTWLPLGEGLPQERNQPLVLVLAFDPADPMVLYAGTGGFVGQGQGVYKSTDGGETWAPSNKGMLDYRITALAVDPRNPQIVFAGSQDGDLFKSSDGGQTWTNLKAKLVLRQYGEPRQIRSLQIDPTTGLIYLLGDNSGLLYSGDGGVKWRMVGIPPGTDQPQLQTMAVLFGETPTILLSLIDQGGAWRFGP